MATDRQEMRLVEKALQSGKVTPRQYAESLKVREALEAQGVKKSLVQILTDDGALSKKDLDALDDAHLVGETLGGFLVEAKLGEGGMGAVYRAKQVSLGRNVALKILSPQHCGDPEFVQRFIREARSAARLNHPHVVQPLEIGAEKGYHFFAMELCEGGSVGSRIDKRGRFPEEEALEVVRSVGLALAYAAELHMIHRDIKPDNILFTRTGIPKLADLGLAKDRAESQSFTMTGLILGTPNYMPPEQALGKRDLDIRGDIYALGITLFEMVTGRVPFKGDTPLIVMNQHVNEPLPDARTIVPELSADLVALIAKMTAKDRNDRFRSPRELVAEVERILGVKPSFAGDVTVPARAKRSGPAPVPAGLDGEKTFEKAVKSDHERAAAARRPTEKGRPRSREQMVGAETMDLPAGELPDGGETRRESPAAAAKRQRRSRPDAETCGPGAKEEEEPTPPRHGRKRRIGTAVLLLAAMAGTVLVVRPDLRARAVATGKSLYERVLAVRARPAPAKPQPGKAAPDGYVELGENEEVANALPLPAGEGGGEGVGKVPHPNPLPPGEGTTRRTGTSPDADDISEKEAKRLLSEADRAEAAGELATAINTFRAALLNYEKTAAVGARHSELLVRTGFLEGLEKLQRADYRGALDCLATLPPGSAIGADEPAVRAVCGDGDLVRADLETLIRALGALRDAHFEEAISILGDLRARASAPFAKIAGTETAAMLAFAAASDALAKGGAATSQPLLARLTGEFAKTAFIRSRDAAVKALHARADVEPRLSKVLHARAEAEKEPRWRFTYAFAPAAGTILDTTLITDWHVDKSNFVDEEGLGCRGAPGDASKAPPAWIDLPFARLDEVELVVAPGKVAAFYAIVGPLHVLILNRQGELAASIGQPIVPIMEPSEKPIGRRTITLPKGVQHASAPVKGEAAYRLKIAFTRGPDGQAPAKAEIAIDGARVLTIGGTAEEAALPAGPFHGRLELRVHPNVRVRAASLAGVPDWTALKARAKPK